MKYLMTFQMLLESRPNRPRATGEVSFSHLPVVVTKCIIQNIVDESKIHKQTNDMILSVTSWVNLFFIFETFSNEMSKKSF